MKNIFAVTTGMLLVICIILGVFLYNSKVSESKLQSQVTEAEKQLEEEKELITKDNELEKQKMTISANKARAEAERKWLKVALSVTGYMLGETTDGLMMSIDQKYDEYMKAMDDALNDPNMITIDIADNWKKEWDSLVETTYDSFVDSFNGAF